MGNEPLIPLGPGARTVLNGLGAATQNCLAKVDWPDALFGVGPLYKGRNPSQSRLVGAILDCLV